jgi:hypothetical protein
MKRTLLFVLANVLGYAALLSELAAQKNRETLWWWSYVKRMRLRSGQRPPSSAGPISKRRTLPTIACP